MQQMAKINYEYLNHAIDILEDLVKRIETNPPKKKRRIEIYGFYVKRPKCLNDTFNQLIRESIISDKTEKKDFAQVFTGGNPNNKIIWLKGPGLLRYFIKEIDGKGIRYTGKNIWNATVSCFKNKDGTEFNKEQFRHGKIPKEVEIIESIIDTINEDAYSED
jgi:hypothetical protein